MTVKQTYCDYDMSRGSHYPEGLGCFKGKVTHKTTLIYNNEDQVIFFLCSSCHRILRDLAIKQGYEIKSTEE